MAGSALLWNRGHYAFGNADENALANQNNLGNEILEREEKRQARIQSNADTNDPNVIVNQDNELLKKKRRLRPAYSVDGFLCGPNGLDFLNEKCKNWKFKGKGHERSDLRRLIERYREWAFIMYPSMRFEDIVQKTQTFSSKNRVKSHLQMLRDKRDGVNVIQFDENDENEDIDLVINDTSIAIDNNRNNNNNNQLQRQPDNDNNINNNNNNNNIENNIDSNATNNDGQNNSNNNSNNNNMNTNNNNNYNYNNFWGDANDIGFEMPNDFDIDRAD